GWDVDVFWFPGDFERWMRFGIEIFERDDDGPGGKALRFDASAQAEFDFFLEPLFDVATFERDGDVIVDGEFDVDVARVLAVIDVPGEIDFCDFADGDAAQGNG